MDARFLVTQPSGSVIANAPSVGQKGVEKSIFYFDYHQQRSPVELPPASNPSPADRHTIRRHWQQSKMISKPARYFRAYDARTGPARSNQKPKPKSKSSAAKRRNACDDVANWVASERDHERISILLCISFNETEWAIFYSLLLATFSHRLHPIRRPTLRNSSLTQTL